MSLVVARKKRTALFLSIAGLLIMAAAVSAVSARDPDGVTLRVGMVMMTVGAALWLPWQALAPAALLIWLGPNYGRALVEDTTLFGTDMMLELPGLLGLALFSGLARHALRRLEEEDILIGATSDEFSGVDADTGVYEERLMRPAVEAELARSRRFNRPFALVLVGIDEMRQRFDYRDEESWTASFTATANLLRSTRNHVDRAYRYGASSFALILPESGEREVTGLIRRLRRVSRRAEPAEGEVGGPLPTHFGATFYPTSATTSNDLLRRAEIALKVAEKSSTRVQIDGAAAPDLPPPETLRREEELAAAAAAIAALEAGAAGGQEKEPVALPQATPAMEPVLALIAEEPAAADEVAELEAPVLAIAAIDEVAIAEEPAEVVHAAVVMPIPLYGQKTVQPVAAFSEEPEMDPEEPDETRITAMPEHRPFTVVPQMPVPVIMPSMEIMQPAAAEEVMKSASLEEEPQPIMAGQAAPLDDSMTDLMKHLDETLAMIRSLRTGQAS